LVNTVTFRVPRILAAIAAIAIAIAATAAIPAAATAAPRTCSALTGGTRLVNTASLKVVRIRSHDRRVKGSRVFGCVKPNGRVRLLGVSGIVDTFMFTDQTTTVGSVAGTYLTLARSFDTEAGPGPDYRTVVNLRSGRARRYYAGIISNCGIDPTPPVAREILGKDGRLVAIYAAPADPGAAGCPGYRNAGQAQIRGLRPDGQLQTLELAPVADIPVDSLTLDGADAGWTRAGRRQTARIGGGAAATPMRAPKRSCRQLRGTNLSPSPRLRIVKVGNAFLGCAPRSLEREVYTLGAASGPARLKIDKVAGPVVAYTFTRGHRVTKGVISLETGAGSAYWDANLAVDCATDFQAAAPPPAAIALNADVGLVAVFANADPATAACYPNAGQALVATFNDGYPITFDLAPATDILPSSLGLSGRTVSWTRAGVPRHATV
jgi:hypothetical protein